jgi:hypothetical protein
MRIQGIDGMSREQVQFEVQRGGRFVYYYYCFSVLILTFRRPTDIYFLKTGDNAVVKGLPWTLLTLLAGWWGIPWGPIYSVQSLVVNLRGGKDVTPEILNAGPAVASTFIKPA